LLPHADLAIFMACRPSHDIKPAAGVGHSEGFAFERVGTGSKTARLRRVHLHLKVKDGCPHRADEEMENEDTYLFVLR
jgi:hypothetical protein